MRGILRWLWRGLVLMALLAIAVGLWQRDKLVRLWAVNTLFSESRIVQNFSHMDAAFLTTLVPRGDGPVHALPQGPALTLPRSAASWIERRAVTSLLVLQNGQILFEDYFLGTTPDDQRISWSMAKSYLSALLGVLLDEGAITSITDPVTKYAPKLVGSAYQGATIRDVLTMSSGVKFNEDVQDFHSDINRMGRVVALGGELDDFTAALSETTGPPGVKWTYVSMDTHVLGMVIRGATGRPVADLLSEKIIAKLGQERDGYYITDGAGVAFVLGGLNLTTRDYARFGAMIEQNGTWQGVQVVPENWVRQSTAASAPTQPGKRGYGFQWWIPKGAHAGEFSGQGAYGQQLYIDQPTDVVVVVTAADRYFDAPGVSDENTAMMRAIAKTAQEQADGT